MFSPIGNAPQRGVYFGGIPELTGPGAIKWDEAVKDIVAKFKDLGGLVTPEAVKDYLVNERNIKPVGRNIEFLANKIIAQLKQSQPGKDSPAVTRVEGQETGI